MTSSKTRPAHAPGTTRDRVLAAAERLLGEGSADFSMRDLAAAAGVSFATPFNQFGSKLEIMRALSAERIERMHRRAATAASVDSVQRVLDVVAIAAAVMTETPRVNRAVMAAIGAPGSQQGSEPGAVRERSRALWAEALGDAACLSPAHRVLGRLVLPDQLAIAFRGVLSFWTAGEIQDPDLRPCALASAAALLFGFVDAPRQALLAELMPL
jgi:AcrR family transcriptional regulator